MTLAELNLPAHDWLAQPQWGRLRDALHLLSLRAAALECLLEGGSMVLVIWMPAAHMMHVISIRAAMVQA